MTNPMERRQFLQRTAAAFAAAPLSRLCGADQIGSGPLAGHRLAVIETEAVPLLWPRHVGRNAKRGQHGNGPAVTVVIAKTDQGAVGWGELIGPTGELEALRPVVMGRTVDELFAPDRGIRRPEFKPLDFALHDLAGVILGQPVWKMLGAQTPQLFPIYSGMIYFDDLDPDDRPAGIDHVLKNCAADREYGYRQLKVKIGRGKKWMAFEAGLKRDIEVVRAIAGAYPDCQLLVDGNDGFTAETFIRFLQGIEGIPLVWIEEPFVEDDGEWRKLHAWTRANARDATLLADGEQGNIIPVLERLEADGILSVRLTDIAGHGFTRWRETIPRLKATKTLASPHCWGSGLKSIYTAHLLGGLGNGVTTEGVTCSHEHVDFGENLIRDGKLQLSTKAGFGLALREDG